MDISKIELSNIYHDLHRIPELEFNEYKTSEYIKSKLDEYNIEYKSSAKTGIIANIYGKNRNDFILLRADIDALPLNEESGVEFSSENDGIMHACGHDAHITCLLGAAKKLSQMRENLNCSVRLVFQPAEEGVGGADKMIGEGALQNVRYAFALHVDCDVNVGEIAYKDGGIMASPDDYKLVINGKGGHGAEPEKCINPLKAACMIYQQFSNVKNKYFNNTDDCIITVCTINGGTFNNIISDYAVVTGTARTYSSDIREKMQEIFYNIAKNVERETETKIEYIYNKLFPPLINDESANKIVIEACNKLKNIKINNLEKGSMTGDDFSYFAEKVPSSYFKLGVRNESIGCIYPIHSNKFKIDEDSLKYGTDILAEIVLSYSKRLDD